MRLVNEQEALSAFEALDAKWQAKYPLQGRNGEVDDEGARLGINLSPANYPLR